MIRRFNYTDRQRIPGEDLEFTLDDESAWPLAFNMKASFSFEKPLQSEASVFVEAYTGPTVMQFDWGTVGEMCRPSSTALVDIPKGVRPLFRVKVVDMRDEKRRILAWADQISLRTPEEVQSGTRSIIPVETVPLGKKVWNLRFDGTQPILQLNSEITQPRDITSLAKDADFVSLVYPAVIRQILSTLLLSDIQDSVDEGHDWLRFGKAMAGSDCPDDDAERYQDNVSEYKSDVESWIDSVVDAYNARENSADLYVKFRTEGEKHG